MYDVLTIADAILKIAKQNGKCLTPMQLVKLTYIAHGWSLAALQRDLFQNRIEAWRYGPVIPDLYHATKSYGRNPIPLEHIHGDLGSMNIDPDTMRLLHEVYAKYGHLDGISLSYLTHKANTPWSQVYSDGYNCEIPDHLIAGHYQDLMRHGTHAQ